MNNIQKKLISVDPIIEFEFYQVDLKNMTAIFRLD